MTTYPETLVARVTGIDKRTVAKARKAHALAKPADWLTENSCVVYTGDGLKKICAVLGVDAAALRGPETGAEPAPQADAAAAETQGSAATGEPSATPPDAALSDLPDDVPEYEPGHVSATFRPELITPGVRAKIEDLMRAHAEKISPTRQEAGNDAQLNTTPAGADPTSSAPPAPPPAAPQPGQEIEHQLAAATVAAGVDQLQASAELHTIAVTRLAPNPRIVFGRIGDRPVIVGVRENKNFKPGMQLQANHAGGDYFRFVGNCPRWPGRW